MNAKPTATEKPEENAPTIKRVEDPQETFQEPNTKEVALIEPTGFGGYTNKDIATLRKTAFSDCRTLEETAVACTLAKVYGLDPFAKEIWAMIIQGNLIIEASAAGWRKLIRRNDTFKHMVVNAWYPSDTIKFDWVNQKVAEHTSGSFTSEEGKPVDETPVGAYVLVTYQDGTTNLDIALWSEYGKPGRAMSKAGKEYSTPWQYKREMIKQKASALFGRTYCGVSGLYAQGEVQTSADIVEINKEKMGNRIEKGENKAPDLP